jgi:hypothetical protein
MYAVNKTTDANPFSYKQMANINNLTLTTNASSENLNTDQINSNPHLDYNLQTLDLLRLCLNVYSM